MELMEKFQKVEDLDSMTFVEIPQRDILEPEKFRLWLLKIEMKWMIEFNKGNEYHHPRYVFNEESGISEYFEKVLLSSKLYRYDGTEYSISEEDYRAKRGLLIRDHYSKFSVEKVQLITDNLVEFLKQAEIEHNRRNFKKRA